MKYTVPLDGVALRTDPTHEYPPGRNPYDHQRETDKLFDTHEKFAAMNTAPTGGGKTDSWLHAVLKHQLDTIAFYPRNSLIADQKESIREFVDEFNGYYGGVDVEVVKITKDALDTAREAELGTPDKGQMLSTKLHRARNNADVVIMLTNPDILVQMWYDMYRNNNVRRELCHFEVAVSDEFHMCDLKQRNTLLGLLEEMYDRDEDYIKLSKVLFLSATPERALQRKLDHTSFDFHHIRSDVGRCPLSLADTDGNARAVMPQVDLELRRGGTFKSYARMFSEDHLPETLEFCSNAGENGVLVIVDSLQEVNATYEDLCEYMPDDLTIHKISGYDDENKAEKLRTFDILVSNSAIEVGIDFDVDRILFSAASEDSLVQRLGRLRNKNTVDESWKARCYVPRDVITAFKQLPETDRRISRQGFEFILGETHQSVTKPQSFSYRYSALEMYYNTTSMEQRAGNFTPDSREEYRAEGVKRIRRHCFDPYDREWNREELRRIYAKTDSELMDHLQTYRSKSLQTLIYDTEADRIRMYNPFQLIRAMDVVFVSDQDFYARTPDRHHARAQGNEPYADCFAICHGMADRTSDDDDDIGTLGLVPSQSLRREVSKDIEEREPIVTGGLQVHVDDPTTVPGLKHLNDELEASRFICYPTNGHRNDTTYDLDPFTTLYDLCNVRENMKVALGHDALYLHCAVLDSVEDSQ